MPIKNINELLNMTITNQKKKNDLLQQEKGIKNSSMMKEVVPPLHRGDFLDSWKADREQLEKVRAERDKIKAERDKLKKVINTRWSKDWPKPNDV